MIVSLADGSIVGQLHGHMGSIPAVELARNGELLISGATDGSVKVWEIAKLLGGTK